MFSGERDLPLARDSASRFMPWIVGFMVYLAVLALSAAMLVSGIGQGWRDEVAGTMTVQIMPATEFGDRNVLDARTAAALNLLRGTPGIAQAEVVPDAQVAALLEPWLGPGIEGAGLPLPRLIDVKIRPGQSVDTAALGARLADAVPGTTLDDHGLWLERLLDLARAIEVVAVLVVVMISLAATATVVFMTRAELAIHQEVIEVLHLVGAEDRYIARQFQANALRLALKGGFCGLLLATATLVALGVLARGIENGLMPEFSLSAGQWLALVCVPVAAAAIVTATARLTVLRAIGRMV